MVIGFEKPGENHGDKPREDDSHALHGEHGGYKRATCPLVGVL